LQEERSIVELMTAEFNISPLPPSELASPFTVILPTEALALMLASDDDAPGTEHPAAEEKDEGNQEGPLGALQLPIWQQPPRFVGFGCDRPTGKAVAKALVAHLIGK
jgi:hypothetical protein